MTSWWSDHPDLEAVARRGRRELHEESVSAEQDTELLRRRRRQLIDVCYEWMSRGDLVTISTAGHEFEGRLLAAVNDLVVVATRAFEVAINIETAEFVRCDRPGAFAGSSGNRTIGSFRAALGRAEMEQIEVRVVGCSGVFDVTGVIDTCTADHILMRDRLGLEWALPRSNTAFAVGDPATSR